MPLFLYSLIFKNIGIVELEGKARGDENGLTEKYMGDVPIYPIYPLEKYMGDVPIYPEISGLWFDYACHPEHSER
ncbi:MAG: hypothetical protein FJZ16_05025 [Candidatus Omnitrophica bacterium]|nr:hypothetical protein [Candidatus Omnitrophota bacterium]